MEYSKFIDHTLLKADAIDAEIKRICEEAIKFKFKAVCINSIHIPLAKKMLKNSDVLVCTVVGFPLGASPKEVKTLEAQLAIENGADEVDMVINIAALKDKKYDIVKEDIISVAKECHKHKKVLKVIIETCLLNDEEKVNVCKIAMAAKADFVKTSTGFSNGGATIEDITLMRKTVGPSMGVKASGGVRDLISFKTMIEAGATRIGTSSGVKIMQGQVSTSNY